MARKRKDYYPYTSDPSADAKRGVTKRKTGPYAYVEAPDGEIYQGTPDEVIAQTTPKKRPMYRGIFGGTTNLSPQAQADLLGKAMPDRKTRIAEGGFLGTGASPEFRASTRAASRSAGEILAQQNAKLQGRFGASLPFGSTVPTDPADPASYRRVAPGTKEQRDRAYELQKIKEAKQEPVKIKGEYAKDVAETKAGSALELKKLDIEAATTAADIDNAAKMNRLQYEQGAINERQFSVNETKIAEKKLDIAYNTDKDKMDRESVATIEGAKLVHDKLKADADRGIKLTPAQRIQMQAMESIQKRLKEVETEILAGPFKDEDEDAYNERVLGLRKQARQLTEEYGEVKKSALGSGGAGASGGKQSEQQTFDAEDLAVAHMVAKNPESYPPAGQKLAAEAIMQNDDEFTEQEIKWALKDWKARKSVKEATASAKGE